MNAPRISEPGSKTENEMSRYDRRGAERGRRLTPGEMEQQRLVREAMWRYELFRRDVGRDERLRLWKGIAWGLVLTAIVALGILWILRVFKFL